MRNLTGRQILLIAAASFLLATIAVGIYGLVHGPDTGRSTPAASATDATTRRVDAVTPPEGSPAVHLDDRTLPHTNDPITYARAIATSLFDWDTTSGYLPTDYTAAALADADPSGEETPALLDDVATYLPTTEQWLALGAIDVAQSIAIQRTYVPDSWAAALAQAHGQVRPGTTAVTISGTRHRSGTWNGEPANSSSLVSFTVFVACPPAFDRCHVLRLSQLDNPLM